METEIESVGGQKEEEGEGRESDGRIWQVSDAA